LSEPAALVTNTGSVYILFGTGEYLTWLFHLKHPVHWGFLGGNVWSSEVEMWDMGNIPV